jgi:ribosomal protein S18 acetylase RimI-like enzyme
MIRTYRNEDHDAVVALWSLVFPDPAPHNEPDRVLKEKLEVDELIFVAEVHDTIAGTCMAGYDGHRGWLYTVAVSPEHRRNGIGSGLVKYAILHLEELGCSKINLQIRATNLEVHAFYESLGFVVEDRVSMGRRVGR